MIIPESGVKFGPFNDEQLFWIEKSKFYDNGSKGCRTVEFLYVNEKRTMITIVEAKTTAPNINNPESKSNVQKYIHELEQKIYHTLAMYFGLSIGRHEDIFSELPEKIRKASLKSVRLNVVLVITNFEDEWVEEWNDLLNSELKGLKNAWNNLTITVLNETMAKEIELIL